MHASIHDMCFNFNNKFFILEFTIIIIIIIKQHLFWQKYLELSVYVMRKYSNIIII